MNKRAVKDLVVGNNGIKGKNEKGFGVYFISFYLELFILFQQNGSFSVTASFHAAVVDPRL